MTILGIDPGFAALGCAVMEVTAGSERVLQVEVVRTEKSNRKAHVRAAEDQHRRACILAGVLHRLVAEYRVVAFAVEAPSFGRGGNGSGAAFKTGISWGVISTLALLLDLPVVQASPQDVKKALCGRKNASKEDVEGAIERRYPDLSWPRAKDDREHVADAAGVVVACLDSEVVRALRHAGDARLTLETA